MWSAERVVVQIQNAWLCTFRTRVVQIQNAWGSRGRRESPPGVIEERCTEAERSEV